MTMTVKLATPRMIVVLDLDGHGDPSGYREVELQTTQADAVRYDLLRLKNGWPAVSDAPVLWSTVLAWAALMRTGEGVSTKFETAMGQILSVTTLTAEGEPATDSDEVGVDPTPGTA